MGAQPCPSPEDLLAFHLGQLAAARIDALADHVTLCARCESSLQELDTLTDPVLAALRLPGAARQTKNAASFVPETPPGGRSPTLAEAAHPQIPGYDMLGLLGRGGMGLVYMARHQRLDRLVAIKRLRVAGDHEAARFQTEAEAIARLQHPNIVQIHEVGDWDGQPYLALELVEGGALAEQIDATPQDPRRSAELVEKLARAVHYAHQRGIIHRDLKPANILLQKESGHDGQSLPKITDFGIAKQLSRDTSHTSEGAILGTPAYMSPEQAAGAGEAIGPATDTYALGVILYEMLTGRVPLQGPSDLDTIVQVRTREPVGPRQLQPDVPRDLETICLKCLRKEPGQRYASAEKLADDLTRFLNNEPILARPVGRWERVGKWVRRHPAVALLLAALVLVSATGFALVIWQWREAVWQKDDADEQRIAEGLARQRAQKARDETAIALVNEKEARQDADLQKDSALRELRRSEMAAYGLRISLVQRDLQDGFIGRATQSLAATRPELRHWEHRWLDSVCRRRMQVFGKHLGALQAVAFSPDDARVAATDGAMVVKVWDRATAGLFAELETDDIMESLAYTPAGLVLSGRQKGEVLHWDLVNAPRAVALVNARLPLGSNALSRDGRRLAAADLKGTLSVWDTATGQLVHELPGHAGGIRSLIFTLDGALLASTDNVGQIKVWDLKTGRLAHTITGPRTRLGPIAFSADAKYIAAGGDDRKLRLWEAATGKLMLERDQGNPLESFAFNPKKSGLACAFDSAIQLWDMPAGIRTGCLRGHSVGVRALAFSADGRFLTSGGGSTVRVWEDGASGDPAFRLIHPKPVLSVALHPQEDLLATMDEPGTIRLWDLKTGTLRGPLHGHTEGGCLTFSPDGKFLGAGGRDRIVRLWDWSAKTHRTLDGHKMLSAAFSADSRLFATAGVDGKARLWDLKGGGAARSFTHGGVLLSLAFHPHDRALFTAGTQRSVKMWDVDSGAELWGLEAHDQAVHALACSPDGKWLATGSLDKTIKLWDVKARRLIHVLQGHGEAVQSLAFTSDSRRLISASWDQTAKLWDVATGLDVCTLGGHAAAINGVAVSADARYIATAGADDSVRVWAATVVR